MTDVYLPAEDTTTLARVLRSYSGASCLEIGFGSGAILSTLVPRFQLVVGTDVLSLQQAVSAARASTGAEVVLADRATCFRDGVFDLVVFNPPYLPSESIEDRTVDGGKEGLEVPLAFLDEAFRVLTRGGKVVTILSSEASLDEFGIESETRGLVLEEKSRTALFFENLVVFEVRRKGE
jgi:release factor glutamine methyltransferase